MEPKFRPSVAASVAGRPRISTRATLLVSVAAIVAATFAGAAPGGGPSVCSNIERYQLEKQLNLTAERILASCGRAPAASSDAMFSPLALLIGASRETYGGGDVDLITSRPQTPPHVTQSTSQVWPNGTTLMAAYNDSEGVSASPLCIAGGSRSTDGGATWTNTHPFCTDSAANFGSPALVYDPAVSKWMAVFLSAACGAGGLGLWASTDNGLTWARTSCAHSGSSDDRPSMWVDGNAGSPFYGRVYVTWNDFAVGGGALQSTFSTDGGFTWSAASTVFGSFRRNVGTTTSPGTDGRIYVAAMDEGGGGLAGMRQNYVHRSTDGGNTWSSSTAGSAFLGPGRAACSSNSYFVGMYTTPIAGYWRTMGWGDIGVGPSSVVHLAYASRPGTGDPGDVYYTRSTDTGFTWSAPLKLNTDAGTRGQWQPSLAVTPAGRVFASWYDERNTTAENGYERFGRLSTDGGATWLPDDKVSDVVSPKPLQSDINPCYVSDYDRAYGAGTVAHTTWTDGRVAINGQNQPDVFYDTVSGPPTAVTLASFTATRGAGGIRLRWRTATEAGAIGFNVYRELGNRLTKLNRSLIPTRAAGPTGGHPYSWLDARASRGPLRYRLQAVSSRGARSWVGAASVR